MPQKTSTKPFSWQGGFRFVVHACQSEFFERDEFGGDDVACEVHARRVCLRGKEESLDRFHPWVFSGALRQMPSQGEGIDEGEVVAVEAARWHR